MDDIGTELTGCGYVILWGSAEWPADEATVLRRHIEPQHMVQAIFARDRKEEVAGLRKGQTITIEGECRGRPLLHVVVNDCRLVNEHGNK